MIFYDSESCGLHGMMVLLQYAIDDGPIELYDIWRNPIIDTLHLIEWMLEQDNVGFNLAFDHFHLCKIYTIFSLYPDAHAVPEDIIEELAILEPQARDGLCLKPKRSCDLMLWARKGHYQATMDRKPIKIRRVPTTLAWELASELEKRVKLKDFYFANRKKKNEPRWKIVDIEGTTEFKNIVLKFAPSIKLKVLAADALGHKDDDILLFRDIEVDRVWRPKEVGYAPYAMALGKPGAWDGTWPSVIKYHIDHWANNELARKYAKDDVKYTRELYHYFGDPEPGDDDSELATMVAANRWRGYKIDVEGMKELKNLAISKKRKFASSPKVVRRYIEEFMSEDEKLILNGSTKKVILEEVTRLLADCPTCNGNGDADCKTCKGEGIVKHPSAARAQEVLDARKAAKEIENYDKLILAGRFHAAFKIIGALSSRMSGDNDLNAQGIKKAKFVREKFILAWPGMILCGGDFSAFEVTIADAVYNDPKLRADLLSGKKIHGLFGVHVYPDMTYEEILATEGKADDRYTKCKSAVFAMLYGGTGYTLKTRLGVDIEVAEKAFELFNRQYKGAGRETKRVTELFSALRQPDGIGSKIYWKDPCEKIESLFGFPRFFTLENQVIKTLFELAESPPKSWMDIKIKTQRRKDGPSQYVGGALRSAIFGAAFGIQSSNIRAAKNHRIQSTGASATKKVQRRIWDLQPHGVHEWLVQPMNIHDEIMCPCVPEIVESVKETVATVIEELRPTIPLVGMKWMVGLSSWAGKSG